MLRQNRPKFSLDLSRRASLRSKWKPQTHPHPDFERRRDLLDFKLSTMNKRTVMAQYWFDKMEFW